MVLSIFAVLLVLGITFMHSLFGLFSGLINAFCCLTAMITAFGFADLLNDLATQQGVNPSYTLPACFVGLFLVTHVLLRVLADRFLRGNVRVPMYVDWVGGAVCGFVIGQVTVGVVVLGFLMLPFGGRAMQFSRIERAIAGKPEGQTVPFRHNSVGFGLRPDEFTLWLFNLLSNGSLRGQTAFASVYPNYADWVFWTGNTVQSESATAPLRSTGIDGFGPGGLKVDAWWWQKGPLDVRYRWKLPIKIQPLDNFVSDKVFPTLAYQPDKGSGKRLLGVRLKLLDASADRDEGSRHHRFRSTMIRIVGDVDGEPKQYYARVLGGMHPDSDALRLADPDNNFALPAKGETPVEAYFEADEGFRPHFVEYRRFARAAVPAAPLAEAPRERLYFAFTPGLEAGQASGPARFIDAVIRDGTGDKAELPLAMSAAALGDQVELYEGKFLSGRITGKVADLTAKGPIGAVQEIELPEGRRLFQLACQSKKARSLAGQVFNFVGSVVNQYHARDDKNNDYPLSGYYAIVKRDGQDFIELFLVDETEEAGYRGLLDFKSVTNQELRADDTIIGLLFFVDPGVRIAGVVNQTGQGVEFPAPDFQMSSEGG